jgi:hypothetical protein
VFRAVRELSKSLEGSNPTWVPARPTREARIDLAVSLVDQAVCKAIGELEALLTEAPGITVPGLIVQGCAAQLPLRSGSVDAIVTSPPYLTRIDYAVTYARELAVLGHDVFGDRRLRESLTGTTLIRSRQAAPSFNGVTGREILARIHAHPAKDSAGYYSRQASQYFVDLLGAIKELSRVAGADATCMLVVQDSYYKDIHLPLAKILAEEFRATGWSQESEAAFPVRRLLTSLNAGAKRYAKGAVEERVLLLRRKA